MQSRTQNKREARPHKYNSTQQLLYTLHTTWEICTISLRDDSGGLTAGKLFHLGQQVKRDVDKDLDLMTSLVAKAVFSFYFMNTIRFDDS
jgi:hypothetical protein